MTLTRLAAVFALAVTAFAANARDAHAQRFTTQADIMRNATIRRPTVSPYLNLFTNSNSATPNYYSYVKPLLEQDRDNRQQTERVAQLQQELNQTSARLNSEAAQRQGVRPTGHQTAYMNYLHYFRSPQQQPGYGR